MTKICALSDLRLLSRHPHLEFVDLTNNPIVHLEYYQEFLAIFVQNLKTLDRLPVDRRRIEKVREDSRFIKDLLSMLLENYLKIISAKSVSTRLALNEEFRRARGISEEVPIKRVKMFDILQENIIESFDRTTLIEFEAYLMEDIEMLMDQYFPNQL